MMKLTHNIMAIIGAGFLISSASYAQDAVIPTTESVDMATVSCRDLMVEDDIGKSAILGYLLGYASGLSSDTVLVATTVEAVTEGLVNYCLDNPTENLIKAFDTLSK
jgi:hypothetical protein